MLHFTVVSASVTFQTSSILLRIICSKGIVWGIRLTTATYLSNRKPASSASILISILSLSTHPGVKANPRFTLGLERLLPAKHLASLCFRLSGLFLPLQLGSDARRHNQFMQCAHTNAFFFQMISQNWLFSISLNVLAAKHTTRREINVWQRQNFR